MSGTWPAVLVPLSPATVIECSPSCAELQQPTLTLTPWISHHAYASCLTLHLQRSIQACSGSPDCSSLLVYALSCNSILADSRAPHGCLGSQSPPVLASYLPRPSLLITCGQPGYESTHVLLAICVSEQASMYISADRASTAHTIPHIREFNKEPITTSYICTTCIISISMQYMYTSEGFSFCVHA